MTKEEDLAFLRQVAEASAQAITPELQRRFRLAPAVVGETTAFIRTLGNAPVCILAFLRKQYPHRETELVSVAAAIENLLLTACDRGLGACWIGAAVNCGYGEAVTRRFGPPEGELAAMITVGHSAQEPKAPRRRQGRWEIR